VLAIYCYTVKARVLDGSGMRYGMRGIAKLEGEKKDNFESLLTIIAYNLSLPRISFIDKDFPQEIAIKTMEFLKKMYDELMNKELQEETPKEDAEFKEAALAFEGVKAQLDEAAEE
jgi:hypothetical protein